MQYKGVLLYSKGEKNEHFWPADIWLEVTRHSFDIYKKSLVVQSQSRREEEPTRLSDVLQHEVDSKRETRPSWKPVTVRKVPN